MPHITQSEVLSSSSSAGSKLARAVLLLSSQEGGLQVTPKSPLSRQGSPETAEQHRSRRRFDRTHRLRHRMIGEAPHLLDPEVLDSSATADGKQRGLYYCPSSQGRSPESAAEFVDSIFEVPLACPALPVLRLSHLTGSTPHAAFRHKTALPALQGCKAEDTCKAVSRRHGCQAGSLALCTQ